MSNFSNFYLNSFFSRLLYFTLLSTIGFCVLQSLNPRISHQLRPSKIDVFFTSVSAATVSSISTVEIEVFSNAQLIVLAIVMFFGGEVFVSMATLHLGNLHTRKSRYGRLGKEHPSKDEQSSKEFLSFVVLGYLLGNNILGTVMVLVYIVIIPNARQVLRSKDLNIVTFSAFTTVSTFTNCGFVPTNENMIVFRNNSGLLLILMAQALLGNVLYPSGLRFLIWVVCKFVKNEESNNLLTASGKIEFLPLPNSWLLLVTVLGFIAVQFILFCSLEWKSNILAELNSYQKVIGILFQTVNSRHAGETIVNLSVVSAAMLVLFIVMMYLPPYTSFIPVTGEGGSQTGEGGSKTGEGGSQTGKGGSKTGEGGSKTGEGGSKTGEGGSKTGEGRSKTGEGGSKTGEGGSKSGEGRSQTSEGGSQTGEGRSQTSEGGRINEDKKVAENFIFSQLSYLVMFVILVCITERKKMKEDPLNFNVLSIVFEVISAYGNVGFTMGYSCARQLKPDGNCKDKWYGFTGKWSNEGKIVNILVMIFGRLKSFNMNGGQAWKLL